MWLAAALFAMPLGLSNGDWPVETAKRPGVIRVPAEMIAIGDGDSYTKNHPDQTGLYRVGGWGCFNLIYSHSIAGRDRTIGTVHNQGGNMVFLDGHVEWQHWWKWIEFSDAAARRWNFDNEPHAERWATNNNH
jgi:prepilin-type processing-associated H-X9-DG protein